MSRIDIIQKGKDQNGEYERFAAEEAFLRSQIRTLAIEASKLQRKMLDLRAENGSNAPLADRDRRAASSPALKKSAKPHRNHQLEQRSQEQC